MKFLKQLGLAVALMGPVASCSLKEEPYGFISQTNFYKTEADANAALVYAYAILPEIEYYSRGFITVTELPTEDITLKPDAGASNFEFDRLAVRADNVDLTTTWRYAFIGINRANAVIGNVPGISAMAQANRDQLVGEAYFLRALHYFNVVRLFGAAPLRTAPVTSLEQVNAKRHRAGDLRAHHRRPEKGHRNDRRHPPRRPRQPRSRLGPAGQGGCHPGLGQAHGRAGLRLCARRRRPLRRGQNDG